MEMLLLPFRRFLELSPPQFKVCKKCGAVSEASIPKCPAAIRGSLDICEGADFGPITIDELMARDRTRVYFLKWPSQSDHYAWRQVADKMGLEKLRPN